MGRKKSKRKRVDRETVRKNAARGSSGGTNWFNLPDGVDSWSPDKADRYLLDIIPFEISVDNHPDDVTKGSLWYKMPFAVHRNVGPKDEAVVCPASLGMACPLCEESARLRKEDKDRHEEAISALRTQKFAAYNILNPDDHEKVMVFAFSCGKFANFLEKELQDEDNEEHRLFFDINEDGRTLKVRFTDATFEGNSYLEATRIDFKPREEMDEDEILDAAVQLDTMFNVMPYAKLKSLFLQTSEQAEEEEEEEEEAPKPRSRKPKKEKEEKEEKEEEEEEEEEEDTSECPLCEEEYDTEDGVKSKKLKKTFCSKKCLKKAEASKKKNKKKPDKEDDDEEEEEEKPKKSEKKDKTPECPVKGGTFGEDVDSHDECEDCPLWDACEEANDS